MSTKKQIIEKVNVLIKNCKSSNYWKDKNAVGSSNIRGVASAVQNAECFDEVKLYIQYKIAKGNGWDIKVNNEKFGNLVIKDLEELIRNINNEKEKVNVVSNYFGYLYWAAYPNKQ